MISLKLIVEDQDVVEKINANLSPQIRVWGYERTNNSFSAYQLCDSRIYEYLIPTHSFLPPHPSSYLGRKLVQIAEEKGDLEAFRSRQKDVEGFWERVDEQEIRPVLLSYDEGVRAVLERALFLQPDSAVPASDKPKTDDDSHKTDKQSPEALSQAASLNNDVDTSKHIPTEEGGPSTDEKKLTPIAEGMRQLRKAYTAAKRAYRIPESRLARVREALSLFQGTRNFHNYTIGKSFKDPSAKRVMKSFVVHSDPVLINGTEWLSLKVHGQSFMMHQIRKMVAMAALVVRCGCDPKRILESYEQDKISIPKAPSLGLLLERPVFESYNKRAVNELGKQPIDFEKYEAELNAFKEREIYERIYQDEEKDNMFGNFFNHIDNFPADVFLFVTSGGIQAAASNRPGKHDSADDQALLNTFEDKEESADEQQDAHGNEG